MLELSLEQMKRLAEIVYQGKKFRLQKGVVCTELWQDSDGDLNPGGIIFDPKPDGEDWQQAQALRVIVAAEKWAGAWEVYEQFNDEEKNQYLKGIVCDWKAKDMDLLHAAALALLGDKT